MRPRKLAALTAAGILSLTACSSGDTSAPEGSPSTSSRESVTPPTTPDSVDRPSSGLAACQDEVLETVVNPESVTFGESARYEMLEFDNSDTPAYLVVGTALSINKDAEATEYEWNCRMAWHDGSWNAAYVTVDLEPSVVKHRDQRPSTARDICEDAIKAQLVSPRSAEFTHSRDGIDNSGSDEYVLYGAVESQNRMGVWLESDWICGVNWDDDDDAWIVGRTYVN